MRERTYRNVDVDLDDLADAVVDWFERDGFEVQDFQEGPSIFIQARKTSLMSKLSFTSQALNVRLSPLSRGFRVEVGAGEWLDKGVGAAATGLALRFINPLVALGAGAATGYGIYQQLKLPELLLDHVESYIERHGVDLSERELEERQPRDPRGGRRRTDDVDDELADLRREAEAERRRPLETEPPTLRTEPTPRSSTGRGRTAYVCPACRNEVDPDDNFCPNCGNDLRTAPAVPAPS